MIRKNAQFSEARRLERLIYFSSSLNKLVTLTDLNLAGNNIQSLPQTALSSMENLQVLTLHSNRLRSIPDLRRLTSLEVSIERVLSKRSLCSIKRKIFPVRAFQQTRTRAA